MQLRFTKMHGLGNDFMVLDGIGQSVNLSATQIRTLANRHFGVGFDQLLLVEPSSTPGIDFRYRIFNADGGEVEQCGNGARCFARFVREQGLSAKKLITVATNTGVIQLKVEDDGQVTVDMGSPRLDPAAIPFLAPAQAAAYAITIGDRECTIGAVSMGNPHAVLQVEDIASAPVLELGPSLQRHPRFPHSVNVGFMQVLSRDHIRLRVYERGVGETLACGSGACAAVVVGRLWGLLDNKVQVDLTGGSLILRWESGAGTVSMTGPAVHVFEGQIEL